MSDIIGMVADVRHPVSGRYVSNTSNTRGVESDLKISVIACLKYSPTKVNFFFVAMSHVVSTLAYQYTQAFYTRIDYIESEIFYQPRLNITA